MAIIKIRNAAIDLDAAEIPNLPASKITSGTLNNARISLDAAEIPNLDTGKITTGTLVDARVPNLNASKITAGTIATARLGSGTANATTFLRGDGSYATPSGGKVLQVVSPAYPNLGQQTVTATSYTLIGNYVATITPVATSSKILVVGSAHFDSGANAHTIGLAVYRYIGSGGYANPISYATDYVQASASSRTNNTVQAWSYLDSPNTTSEIGYALHAKTGSGDTIYCNRKTLNITLIEIGA